MFVFSDPYEGWIEVLHEMESTVPGKAADVKKPDRHVLNTTDSAFLISTAKNIRLLLNLFGLAFSRVLYGTNVLDSI